MKLTGAAIRVSRDEGLAGNPSSCSFLSYGKGYFFAAWEQPKLFQRGSRGVQIAAIIDGEIGSLI